MTEKEKATAEAATPTISDNAKVQHFSVMHKEIEEKLDNNISALMEEAETMQQKTMFIVKSANEVLQDSQNKPRPEELFYSLWFEGEFCIFFADSGNGKSLLAVQVANEIARWRKVLYFDFELTEEQFSERYSENGLAYKFNDNFLRVYINPEYILGGGEVDIIAGIEQTMIDEDCSVCIVDNITWLASSMEKAEDAGKLMMRLLRMKMLYGWSLMVIAHTPKREKMQPITDNDLAGSKVIYNLIDSCFSLGKSVRGEDCRYLKQLKTRQRQLDYGAGNVIQTQIVKEGCMVYHKIVGHSTEENEIKPLKDSTHRKELFVKILGDRIMRYTEIVTDIVKECNVSDRTAKTWINEAAKHNVIIKNDDGEYKVVKW